MTEEIQEPFGRARRRADHVGEELRPDAMRARGVLRTWRAVSTLPQLRWRSGAEVTPRTGSMGPRSR